MLQGVQYRLSRFLKREMLIFIDRSYYEYCKFIPPSNSTLVDLNSAAFSRFQRYQYKILNNAISLKQPNEVWSV